MVDVNDINLLSINIPTIIYSRCSTQKQNDININSASINTQYHSCFEYCKNNNLEVKFMKSEICSARFNKNQKKLLEIIENYQNINLVLFDVSRFSRNISDGIKMINKCIINNIIVYFVKENIKIKNNNDVIDFTYKLLDACNESNTLSSRQIASIKYRKSLGNSIGKPRYGFTKIKSNNITKFIDNEKEQLIIKLILKLKFGSLISDLDKLTIKLFNKELKDIDRTDNIIMYGYYNNSSIAYLLNYNNIKYKEKEWTQFNISNIINTNIEEQNQIEDILDKILFEFSKLLSKNLKLSLKDKKEISDNILKKISDINGYKIKSNKNYNIIDCNSINNIISIFNFYKVNFRVWQESDIIIYIEDYISDNKKRTISEL